MESNGVLSHEVEEHSLFMGEFQHAVDEKGRLIMPARFRAELGAPFVITKGIDECLFVYPGDEWAILEQKLRSLPLTRSDARAFVRFFFAGAVECELDKQGRVMLPANLREYAGLQKDVVIIGVATRVEIWSSDLWVKYSQAAAEDFVNVAEKLADLDIKI